MSGPGGTHPGLPTTTRLLIWARTARSVGQGALLVDFALYLHALHWNAVHIGAVLMGAMLFSSALALLIGPVSDRYGRRGFLIAYEIVQSGAAVLALVTTQPALLTLAAVLGTFGQGANGRAGPFAPAEQAWLAQGIPPWERGNVFSLNTAAGFFGMALGGLLAGLPGWLQPWLPGAPAYRSLFVIVLLGSLTCLTLLLLAQDRPNGQADEPAADDPEPATDRREENRLLVWLTTVNALNGLAIGLLGPLMAYWFNLRFGVGPAHIGPVMALGFVLTGFTALQAGRLTRRLGVVNVVVWMRLLGLVLLLALPLAPSFLIAAAIFIVRAAVNMGTVGARQALNISLVNERRHGLAASLGSVSIQFPRALGPLFAGALFHAGQLSAPFLLAAVLQAGYLYLYRRVFLPHDPGHKGIRT
jgi:MFS family permease